MHNTEPAKRMCHQRKLCRHILAVVVPTEPVVGVGQLRMLGKRQEPQAMPVAIGRAIVIVAGRHVWFGETQIEVFLHYGALRVMIRVKVWLAGARHEQLQRSFVERCVFGVDSRPRTLECHWQLTWRHLYNRCADERLHTNVQFNYQLSIFIVSISLVLNRWPDEYCQYHACLQTHQCYCQLQTYRNQRLCIWKKKLFHKIFRFSVLKSDTFHCFARIKLWRFNQTESNPTRAVRAHLERGAAIGAVMLPANPKVWRRHAWQWNSDERFHSFKWYKKWLVVVTFGHRPRLWHEARAGRMTLTLVAMRHRCRRRCTVEQFRINCSMMWVRL